MFSKKNKRKITVDDNTYYWSAKGDDNCIRLFIMTETPSSPKLICNFNYHQDKTVFKEEKCTLLSNQFIVTPYIVRQAIEYGLVQGWKPFEKGKNLNLGHIDDCIGLRLERNKSNIIGRTKQ